MVNEKPLEPDYAAVDVCGLRKVAIPSEDYWERFQISIELKVNRVVCYADGWFSGGAGGSNPPSDYPYNMESKYKPQVEAFTNSLLRDMQQSLRR